MGDGGRDGIPRECCGGGEVTEREIQQPTGEKATGENTCDEEDTHFIIPNVLMTKKGIFMHCRLKYPSKSH